MIVNLNYFRLLVIITVAVGILPIFTSLSFADDEKPISFPSPVQQIKSGTLPENVMCNDGNVLAEWNARNQVVCVSEITAKRMNLKIIRTDFSINILKVEEPEIAKGDDELSRVKEQMKNVHGLTFPIKDKDKFAKGILNFFGDKLVKTFSISRDYHTDYYRGEIVGLSITNSTISIITYENRLNDEVKGKKLVLDMIEHLGITVPKNQINNLDFSIIGMGRGNISLNSFGGDYGNINFVFRGAYLEIIIRGDWINNPKDVPFLVSTPEAFFAVRNMIENEELGISEKDGGICDMKYTPDSTRSKKFVSNNIPYHKIINMGGCTVQIFQSMSDKTPSEFVKHNYYSYNIKFVQDFIVNGWDITDIQYEITEREKGFRVNIEYPTADQQTRMGVLPEDVICYKGDVLALRDTGAVVCVERYVAEEINWIILNDFAK